MTNKRKRNNSESKLTFHKLDWLEYLTIGLALWFMFYPHPYKILFTILLIIPIFGIILNVINGRPSIASLVEITKENNKSKKYDVADFIDVAAWIILLRVILDYEFENFYSLIIPGILGFIIIIILLLTTHKIIEKTNKNKTWIYLSLTFNIFIYSFAGVYGINCIYDDSDPKVYDVKVLDKSISKGRRSTTYNLKIQPWGHHYDSENISVSKEQFDETFVGETVKIDLKQGLFNIPWYYVE